MTRNQLKTFLAVKATQTHGTRGTNCELLQQYSHETTVDRLLELLLRKMILRGDLPITTSGRAMFALGDGTGTPVKIRFTTRAAELGVLFDPDLKLGEAYAGGGLIVGKSFCIFDVLALILSQPREARLPYGAHIQRLVRYVQRRLKQFNSRRRARRNVAHHYDLDDGLNQLFLDADRQYSCAYFNSPDQILSMMLSSRKSAI